MSTTGKFPNYAAGKEITDDEHQRALHRLAAVGQYLYDTMAGNHNSDRPEPMPALAMEHVRRAQIEIDAAIKVGQRTRRQCLGGHLELVEKVGPWASGDTEETT